MTCDDGEEYDISGGNSFGLRECLVKWEESL